MSLSVNPLAITMNAGPQIMSAIIFVTTPKALKLSAYFLIGVVIAVTAGVTITYTLASVLGGSISLGDPSDSGSIGNIIQYVLVGLLVILSIRSYLTRATSEPPRWLGTLQNAKPRTAFMAGLLLLSIFPSDFVVLITVGVNLAQHNVGLVAALPFIEATILIAALPVLSYLLFRHRAQRLMPKVRDWMNKNSWLVSIIVYVILILLILL
jgi:Sap, sulfolipid-1-addressing protein